MTGFYWLYQLANGVMYFSILTSLKLYHVILRFVDGIFSSRFLKHLKLETLFYLGIDEVG